MPAVITVTATRPSSSKVNPIARVMVMPRSIFGFIWIPTVFATHCEE